ncbi:MAG: hypothetical protein Q8P80_02635, partial [Candidatus Levybacteria bacterium]|nr:hypothetical protein [Candidatus Levybacteria bacterium]
LKLRATPFDVLIAEFGPAEAKFLRNVGIGVDESSVVSYTIAPDVKSIGRNYCLPKNEYNPRVVLQNVYELCEEVGIKLRLLDKKARTVGFYLGGSQSVHGRKTYKDYFDSGKEIYERCLLLFKRQEISLSKNYVRQISIWVSSLEDAKNLPLSLFDSSLKNERLISTVDKINQRFGDHTIRNGFLLYADKLTTVPNGYMADKYERTKIAKDQLL